MSSLSLMPRRLPRRIPSRRFGLTLAIGAMTLLSGCSTVDAQRRVEVDFEYVSDLASELSTKRYREPEPIPESLKSLSYEDYQKIRYNQDAFLWKGEGLPFAAGFFHLGYLFENPVRMHEFTSTHEQRIRYLPGFFQFDNQGLAESLPSSLDYAGVRITSNLVQDEGYGEILSFLGATYFRAVAKGQTYGVSARGVAIDSGLSSQEEFPRFVQMWLGKPLGNSRDITIYALMDGPSLSGAFRFVAKPGETMTIEVKSRFFMRESVTSFGIAPFTSMFWRGENRHPTHPDFRPEVHDSDGLIVMERDEPPVWRAIDIGNKTRLSYFSVDEFRGYGLMQRDRDFDHYQDMSAHYQSRPSAWIETNEDWGPGFVKLVELPADSEFHDNVVAFWEPAVLPEAGSVLEYEYTINWASVGKPQNYPTCYATATRVGEDLSYPGTHLFVIDFAAADQAEIPPSVTTSINGPSKVIDSQVKWNPHTNGWRVFLRMDSSEPTTDAVEMRCQLEFQDGNASEIWAYQWTR